MTTKDSAVSPKTLVQRINRALKPDEKQVNKSRGRMLRSRFGEYYMIRKDDSLLLDDHVNLVELARNLGVMQDFEHLVDE